MASSTSVNAWNLTMPLGSFQSWNFTFTIKGTTLPYPLSGTTWEYVVRVSQTDAGSPLIDITTSAGAQGQITVTTSTGTVLLDMYAAATQSLAPGTYYATLWMNPGTSTAFAWVTGNLIIQGTPQP